MVGRFFVPPDPVIKTLHRGKPVENDLIRKQK